MGQRGRGKAIPKWMRWGGWPFVAFCATTVMASWSLTTLAVLAVLGGSTVAAMIVGYLYGRNKRVWCKYLCPVNAFNLLAKLAPWHLVDEEKWRHPVIRIEPINCAPLVPLRHMKGAGDCHVRAAAGTRRHRTDAALAGSRDRPRHRGRTRQTALLCFGLGIAIGAFLERQPLVRERQAMGATWLVEHDIMWPLLDNAPWFIHALSRGQRQLFLAGRRRHPDVRGRHDDLPAARLSVAGIADRIALARPCRRGRHAGAGPAKLAQALIPSAGIGVFLSATTVNLLKHEGVRAGPRVRFTLLTLAVLAASVRRLLVAARRRAQSIGVAGAGGWPGAVLFLVLFFAIW